MARGRGGRVVALQPTVTKHNQKEIVLLAVAMERMLMIVGSVYGFLAVALGAFGAHGLKSFLAALEDGAQRQAWWQTAAHYHLMHALALVLTAYVASRTESTAVLVAGVGFALGVLVFSGSLYVMTLTGIRWLGAITPIGGLLLLLGWAALGVAAFKLR